MSTICLYVCHIFFLTLCVCVYYGVYVYVSTKHGQGHDTGHGNMEVLEKLGQDAVGTII